MSLQVREVPPLRLSTLITTPSGRRYRWAGDEPRPENISSPPQFGDSMPGGFTDSTQSLPRKPGVDYSDLERLSILQHIGPGGDLAGEYRLEKAPRTSGDQMAISPSAVGHQAALEDDKSASMVYIDIDFSHWEDPSVAEKASLQATHILGSMSVDADKVSGAPSLTLTAAQPWAAGAPPLVTAWYDAGAGGVGSLYYAWKRGPTLDNTDTNWSWKAFLSTDDLGTSPDATAELRAAGPGTGTLSATAAKRFAYLQLAYAAVAVGDGPEASLFWYPGVFGNHGLPVRGTQSATSAGGLYASDVIAHAVGRWTSLSFTEGPDGTIQPSALVLPQLEFREPTTVAEILKKANQPHLRDWAVWEGPTFYYHDRGARGRKWRARIGPSQLEETGSSVERLFNGAIVRFNDVDGSSKTVGPPGSGADVTDALLLDTDEQNPANQLGIRRWTMLDMGIVSTTAVATEVGRRFLEETKQLDRSGQAQIVGYCEDNHGVKYPYWAPRSGDTIVFTDAADTSERRIVRTQKDHSTRTCSIDLDAPSEAMDALLERLGATLLPLGL